MHHSVLGWRVIEKNKNKIVDQLRVPLVVISPALVNFLVQKRCEEVLALGSGLACGDEGLGFLG